MRVGNVSFSGQDARRMQFFTERTLAQLQTYFPDELWSRYMLQVAQTVDFIRYALVALSSYHERYVGGQRGETSAALKQYNTALKEVRCKIAPSPQIQLISCLIFVCPEVSSTHLVTRWANSATRSCKETIQQPLAFFDTGTGSTGSLEKPSP